MFQFIQQIDTKCFYLPDIVLPTEDEMVKITENSLLHNIYDCKIWKPVFIANAFKHLWRLHFYKHMLNDLSN